MAQALPFISLGMQVIGGLQQQRAVQAESAGQQAQLAAQAQASEFNARVARENAAIVEGQTKAATDKANRERVLRLGANIASAGASGTGLDSAMDILQSNSAQEELNLLTLKSEGLLKQRSYLQNASLDDASAANTRNQIPLVKSAGKAKSAAGVLTGLSSGIQSASNMGIF
jgi:hypothetical protein